MGWNFNRPNGSVRKPGEGLPRGFSQKSFDEEFGPDLDGPVCEDGGCATPLVGEGVCFVSRPTNWFLARETLREERVNRIFFQVIFH